MSKTAFIFPGQGSQYVGMGKEFYENLPICREVYDLASEVTGLDLPKLCFMENEQIHQTEYTQICMLATEVAIYMALEQNGYQPDVTAGLSLGEYCALVASGVMTAEEAFEVVRKRGIYMQQAVPTGGAMAAVLGLDGGKIEQICEQTEEQMQLAVSVANYNCPGQIVISGKAEAVQTAGEACKEAGAKRVVPLKVSGQIANGRRKTTEGGVGQGRDKRELCSIYCQCDSRLCDRTVTGEAFVRVSDIFTSQMAADDRTNACRRCG